MTDVFAKSSPSVLRETTGDVECDVAIIGSGMGGATLAWALRESGARVLVLERGDFLPRERENWSPHALHREHRYKNSDPWIDDSAGRTFVPGNYHYVGGSTKFYGASLPRFRESDFLAVEHSDGVSPAWPFPYQELERFYAAAEEIYWVHGGAGDPTEPPRSKPLPFPPTPDEPQIAAVRAALAAQGLHPFSLPLAVDWRPGGRCVRCGTCDSYPCMVDAKGDADVAAMRPALSSANVRLMTKANVLEVVTEPGGGMVSHLAVVRDGEALRVEAKSYVVAAGAVNSAALLLRSRASSPDGVANSSGVVGRNYMAHVSSFLVGARPQRDPRTIFEKTIGINDWYEAGPTTEFPLGNVQSLGQLYGETIKDARPWVPIEVLDWIVRRAVDFFVETEDLPVAENRVQVDSNGRVHLRWRPTNMSSHTELLRRMSAALRRCGYPFIFKQTLGIEATAHQCGTVRMGTDPAASVVDESCRAHDVENLWIVDASVFPSSAAVNPALTVAAIALRVAERGEIAASHNGR